MMLTTESREQFSVMGVETRAVEHEMLDGLRKSSTRDRTGQGTDASLAGEGWSESSFTILITVYIWLRSGGCWQPPTTPAERVTFENVVSRNKDVKVGEGKRTHLGPKK
ncbi:hypothetical protein E2C01_005337 [Portunus trituberculatus]|uniref:Uncharacterized protein n=1 Tax=Portunus trituberculatus TaxID=210409 RepID=A0A5B7CSI5_PORTR|nr:hypothetical protein [Portunus trituberculatus]